MLLPINIEKEIKEFLTGTKRDSWVHEFLENGLLSKHNYVYQEGYYILLMDDIIKYLKKYHPEFLKERRKAWRQYIEKIYNKEKKQKVKANDLTEHKK